MKVTSLHELYVDQLKDLYNAEKQLIAALPKLAKAAENAELREAFKAHLEETRVHAQRIETIFQSLDASPKGKHCKAMEGLIEEGSEAIEIGEASPMRDSALMAAAQRVEHYEIAGYGCVRSYARLLGEKEAAEILQQTLDEEGAADKALSALAKGINRQAINPATAVAQ